MGCQNRNSSRTETWNIKHREILHIVLFLCSCSTAFLIQHGPNCIGIILFKVERCSYKLSIRNMLHKCFYRPIWWRPFLNWGLLFPYMLNCPSLVITQLVVLCIWSSSALIVFLCFKNKLFTESEHFIYQHLHQY